MVYAYVRERLYEKLLYEAKEKGVPVSRLIVLILEEWVRQHAKEKVPDSA